MIITQLKGGLGNQLFQYACGRALAYRCQTDLKVDLVKFKSDPQRTYSLRHFRTTASIATPVEVATLTKSTSRVINRKLRGIIQRFVPYYRRDVFIEPHYHFDPNILHATDNTYLIGYWQSEKYFTDIANIIRKEYVLKAELSSLSQQIASNINRVNAINLHVRRGDYVSDALTYQLYGICSLEYYYTAIRTISYQVTNPHFFIFSDDPLWAQEHLKLNHPVSYITHNGSEHDYEDLWLMSQCKHHIIANSTFSWWGAWLAANQDKIVIAPKQWSNNPDYNHPDRIPPSWIIL